MSTLHKSVYKFHYPTTEVINKVNTVREICLNQSSLCGIVLAMVEIWVGISRDKGYKRRYTKEIIIRNFPFITRIILKAVIKLLLKRFEVDDIVIEV